jgi:hypothetical protein
MPFWFTLIMMVLFSAIPAAAVWALVQKWPLAIRVAAPMIAGMAPLTLLGWTIYRNEGGNNDPDPLQFFYTTITVSMACAILAILAMEWRLRHK